MPIVSIIITSFNQLLFLQRAIASARAQTFSDYEIIVVDDASTDGTAAYLRTQHDLVVIHNLHNRGRSYSRNCGWKAAQGKYVAFLDGDDLFTPEKLALQVEILEREPALGMVFGDLQLCDANENDLRLRLSDLIRPATGPNIFEPLTYGNFIPIGSQLVQVEAIKATSGFDETMWSGEDWQLWLKLAAQIPVRYESVIVGKYRMHSGNTNQQRLNRTYGNAMVRRWLIDSPLFARLSLNAQYMCYLSAGISLTKINEISEARRVLAKAQTLRPFNPTAHSLWWLTWLGAERFSRLTDWGRMARDVVRPEPKPFGN